VKLFTMRVLLVLVFTLSLTFMMGVGGLIYLTWPVKVAELHEFHILNPVVCPGQAMEYTVRYTKFMNIPGLAIKEAIAVDDEGYRYTLISEETNVAVGDKLVSRRYVRIPRDMPARKYWLEGTWRWSMGGLRPDWIVKRRADTPFEVVKYLP
jgi:hypothetical protein